MAPRTPLVDPDAYFASRGGFSPVPALLVVVAFWIVAVANTIALTWYLLEYTDAVPATSLAEITTATAGTMGASLLLLWALYTTILHGVTTVAGGSGSLMETVVIAAWGFAPLVVPVSLQLVTTPITHTAVELLLVLTLVFTMVWAVYVWIHGLVHAHDVTVRRAAIAPIITAVFVPAVLVLF